jgi:hypothetical protein
VINETLNRLKQVPAVHQMVAKMPRGLKVGLRRAIDRTAERASSTDRIVNELDSAATLLAYATYEQARSSPRFAEPKRLLRSGYSVYSQHDEDGILHEIFKRVGTTNRYFVEFGVGDGLENCTLYCLLKGWNGAWIDGSADCADRVETHLRSLLTDGQLRMKHSFITAENIETLFAELGVPAEFDLLSVDIDLNDYWVWKAIERYSPRVVTIEYNASYRDEVSCVVPYVPTATWDATNYGGASLKALEELGRAKGYCLVGCNYTGVNAFFVRADLVGDHFAEPYTSEHHYEPPRYFVRMPNGHRPGFGPMVRPTADELPGRAPAPATVAAIGARRAPAPAAAPADPVSYAASDAGR